MSLPELAEADAPPAIAAIYGELKRLSGVPMVALIWRHLATMPGVLEQVWTAVLPLLERGLIQRAAQATSAVPPVDLGLDGRALACAGVDAEGRRAFADVLDAYNRANPINFVTVRTIVHAIGRGGRATSALTPATAGSWSPPMPIARLPPMLPVAAIPADLRRLIDDLGSDPRVDRSQVVPSLYRHLPAWPGLIPLIHGALAPRFRSGEMGRVIAAVREAMDAEAIRLSAMIDAPASLPAPGRGKLDDFSALIPEMVAVGRLLRGRLI